MPKVALGCRVTDTMLRKLTQVAMRLRELKVDNEEEEIKLIQVGLYFETFISLAHSQCLGFRV